MKDRVTSASRDPNGNPYPDPDATTCLVFDRIDKAREFCEATVQAMPQLRCEIYDSEGLAHPPLLVIVQKDFAHQEDTGSFWARRRKLIAVLLFLVAPPLIWLDVRGHSTLIVPTIVAFNCIIAAMRLLFWNAGVRHREREREKRLDAHRRKELGNA